MHATQAARHASLVCCVVVLVCVSAVAGKHGEDDCTKQQTNCSVEHLQSCIAGLADNSTLQLGDCIYHAKNTTMIPKNLTLIGGPNTTFHCKIESFVIFSAGVPNVNFRVVSVIFHRCSEETRVLDYFATISTEACIFEACGAIAGNTRDIALINTVVLNGQSTTAMLSARGAITMDSVVMSNVNGTSIAIAPTITVLLSSFENITADPEGYLLNGGVQVTIDGSEISGIITGSLVCSKSVSIALSSFSGMQLMYAAVWTHTAIIRASMFSGIQITSYMNPNGVVTASGAATIDGTTFLSNSISGNQAGGYGAVVVPGGYASISNCTFRLNSFQQASAVYSEAANITGSVFLDNSATLHGAVNLSPKGKGTVIPSFVEDCYFVGNTGNEAAALLYGGSNITIQGSLFHANSVKYEGGAIVTEPTSFAYGANASMIIQSCIFSWNTAVTSSGGAISGNGAIIVQDTVFFGNTAGTAGGAVYTTQPIFMQNMTFSNNFAGSAGGAVNAVDETIVLNATFSANTATSAGGAIFTVASTTVQESKFVRNVASNNGGALCLSMPSSAVATVDSCTFLSNSAGVRGFNGDGGAIATSHGSLSIASTIFHGNTAVGNGGALQLSNGTVSLSSSIAFNDNNAFNLGRTFYCYNGLLESSVTIHADDAEFDCTACGCCATPEKPNPVSLEDCMPIFNHSCPYNCSNNLNPPHTYVLCKDGAFALNDSELCPAVQCSPPDVTEFHATPSSQCPGTLNSLCYLECLPGYAATGVGTPGKCQITGNYTTMSIPCSPLPTAPPPLASPGVVLGVIIGGGVMFLCLVAMGIVLWRVFRKRGAEPDRELTNPLVSPANSTATGGTSGLPRQNTRSVGSVSYGTVQRANSADMSRSFGTRSSVTLTRGGAKGGSGPVQFSIDSGDMERVEWEDLTVVSTLGKGGFGTVYHVRHNTNYTDMALKMYKNISSEAQLKAFVDEAQVHSKLHHPHCLPFLGLVVRQDEVGFLTQLMVGDLKTAAPNYSLQKKLYALLGACRGLAYLHGHKITHADLKPSNVLVDDRGTAVLADFGLSTARTTGYTERYAAPEVLQGIPSDSRSDIYSMGCVITETLTDIPPFHDTGELKGAWNSLQGAYDKHPLAVMGYNDADALVTRCLDREPARRPTIKEVIEVLTAMQRATDV